MSLNTFCECVKRVPTNVRIDFSGMAEPWLNPDCLAMVHFAAGRGHPLAMFTTLLGVTPTDLEMLAEIHFEPFVIHLPDTEGNSPIPVTQAYLALVEQVLDLLQSGTGWSKVRISCHGTLNPRLAEAFGARLSDANIPVVSSLSDRAGSLKDAHLLHYQVAGRITCSTAQRLLNHNVLLPDGTVILCCMDYGCQHVLGNLLTQPYPTLFTGTEMDAVLAGLDDPALALLCRRCVRAVPY